MILKLVHLSEYLSNTFGDVIQDGYWLILNAFLSMTSRRGTSEVMFSDNWGNFVKADKELKDLLN